MNIIDTHIHIWDLQKAEYKWLKGDASILNQTYSLEQLEIERFKTNVKYGVLVQAANNFEDTDWMLKVAEDTDWIKGVVGWLPLDNPEKCRRSLEDIYLHNSFFKGVRHLIHNENDPEWLLQNKVIESLKILAKYGLPFDIVGVIPKHIEVAMKVSKKVPKLKMVFDHLNQPPIQDQLKFGAWGILMKEAAKNPQFHMKISGLGTTSGKLNTWSKTDISDYIEFIIDHFSINRCMVGGDWPVSLLAGNYSYTWKQYEETLNDILNKEEQQMIYLNNPNSFYNLKIINV
ncbi:amidohydrolase family protein [Zunongwangia endophytica]|uniref:Amidohydrolase family protein n=1 Tax=Zunongwangia endophytica TaxID=1808945 RepID=A0ABV8HBL5_9FLAO|nr:amidohydrolase family protein [Zunongwangia endophytica]MDN3594849.1 amidohydrolase family protein [Zunongwangia endophytica]